MNLKRISYAVLLTSVLTTASSSFSIGGCFGGGKNNNDTEIEMDNRSSLPAENEERASLTTSGQNSPAGSQVNIDMTESGDTPAELNISKKSPGFWVGAKNTWAKWLPTSLFTLNGVTSFAALGLASYAVLSGGNSSAALGPVESTTALGTTPSSNLELWNGVQGQVSDLQNNVQDLQNVLHVNIQAISKEIEFNQKKISKNEQIWNQVSCLSQGLQHDYYGYLSDSFIKGCFGGQENALSDCMKAAAGNGQNAVYAGDILSCAGKN